MLYIILYSILFRILCSILDKDKDKDKVICWISGRLCLPLSDIEVGAYTLKSSSTFQHPTTIMFSLTKTFLKRICENYFWENKAHIFITKYVQIDFF